MKFSTEVFCIVHFISQERLAMEWISTATGTLLDMALEPLLIHVKKTSKAPLPIPNQKSAPPPRNCFHWDRISESHFLCTAPVGSKIRIYFTFYSSSIFFLFIYSSILLISIQGQYWLTSWGYKKQLPVDNEKLVAMGTKAAKAIYRSSRREYKVGAAGALLYPAGFHSILSYFSLKIEWIYTCRWC